MRAAAVTWFSQVWVPPSLFLVRSRGYVREEIGQELTDSYYMMPFQGTLNMFFVMVLLLAF